MSSLSVIRMRKEVGNDDLNCSQPPERVQVSEQVRVQLESILKMLSETPEELGVDISYGERTIIFKVNCSRKDIGRVLGNKGKMITSIRNVASALTAKHGYRSIVEIPYYPVGE